MPQMVPADGPLCSAKAIRSSVTDGVPLAGNPRIIRRGQISGSWIQSAAPGNRPTKNGCIAR
jgi:hypothetical protein